MARTKSIGDRGRLVARHGGEKIRLQDTVNEDAS